ncbi:hypothetical protein HNP38_000273 [Chryseobacterium defluvii]|uniref:Secreted protein (Por secretion system target) n=1 Tax=Chryseobacterium defluvii TaxID=160396 RepID=A0A840K627_9FLAO|nr:T9SS type A sorting domain-containing protein [Chryseobacterium defluvii]MBB4805001.1 hypothetical protein [Chryseobacterium defluvii]
MKKLHLLFLLLMSLVTYQSYFGQTFTLGTCSTHVDSFSYGTPLRSSTTANDKSRASYIIPASQLLAIADGTITSTYFYRYTPTGTLNAGTTLKIYLKNTSAVDYPTAPSWATEIGTATLVYSGDPQAAVGSTAGYKQFVHSTNFVYTSGSNLAVFVEYVQTTAQASSIYWTYDYTGPCVNTSNNNIGRYEATTGAFTGNLPTANYRRPFTGFDVTMPPATTAPACTTVSSPANAATGVSLTPSVSWAGVYGANGASSYLINLGTTPGGTDILNGYNAGNTTSYSIPAGTLQYSTTYYLTVIPTNNIGPATGCTETSFTTLSVPCPSFGSPANNATGASLQPTINWTAVASASGYRLTVGTAPGGSDILPNIDLGNVTSYTFAAPLSPSTQYFYTLVAYQGANASTGCTERNFTTGTATPPANDNCSGAVALTVNADLACGVVTPGNTLGATLSMAAAPCNGNPDDDVWFSFTATSTAHMVSLLNVVATGTGTSTDMYFQVLSGTCGSMTSVLCSDPNSAMVSGLVPGTVYYVRVYNYGSAGANNSFNICIGTPPPAPANDNCANAVVLTPSVNGTCAGTVSGTTYYATNSGVAISPCTGTADDDVWYSFVATGTSHIVTVSNVVSVGTTSDTSLYLQVLTGACGSLTNVICDTSYASPTGLTGLTVGQTYYVRVYNSNTGTAYANTFNICITTPVVPANDDCSNAVVLTPSATATCAGVVSGTTLGSSASSDALTPCSGTAEDDVWYSFVATSTNHTVTLSNVVSTGITSSTSLYLQVLSGACGSLTNVICDTTYATPTLLAGLTVGQTYYVRVYNSNSGGSLTYSNSFDICVTTTPPPPANDECANAVSLTPSSTGMCSSPVSGSTVSATASTGTAPTCSATGINDDVWYTFVATATTHMVNVNYSDNATATQVYSGSCGSLTAIACYTGAYGNSNILLESLTVGQAYYVRVFSSSNTADLFSNFQICITSPAAVANDTCDTAAAISCGGTVEGNNALATNETLPSSSCGGTGTTASYKGVWYTITATANGPITINGCGSQFDAYLRVYTGSCAGLTCLGNTSGVGYADSGCPGANLNNSPTLTFTATAGTTYYVLLSSYSAAQFGKYVISVTQDCSTMGTAEVSRKDNVKAYPNPFTDTLNISDISNVKSVAIIDTAGRLVKTIDKPSSALHLGELKSGMYLVALYMKDGSKQTIKVIKK